MLTWIFSCVVGFFSFFARLFGFQFSFGSQSVERERVKVRLNEQLLTASSYEDWKQVARRLDTLNGFDEWRELSTEYFDADLARQRLDTLKSLKKSGDVRELMHHIRADLHRGIGGIWNPKMHVYHTGSKRLVEEYQQLVELMLLHILQEKSISCKEKYIFFTDLSRSYGHSALVLSGAAALGLYHTGPVKALHSQQLLPRVISGTNTGAIVAALVCCNPDADLLDLLDFAGEKTVKFDAFEKSREKSGGGFSRRLKRFVDSGVLMDVTMLKEFLIENIGDATFMDAYNKTGRILNIVCSRFVEDGQGKAFWALNYLTAPHVVIWSAACASCHVPGIYELVDLMCRNSNGDLEPYHPAPLKWGSGNFSSDERVAWDRLSELFNINYFIVSDTNVSILPSTGSHFDFIRGLLTPLWTVTKEELLHRMTQLSHVFPIRLDFFASLITRPFEGDVEIFPACTIQDCLKMLNNPEKSMIQECMTKGEKRTWPKLNTISSLCRIERTLDSCTKQAKHQLSSESPHHKAFYTNELNMEVLNTL